MGVSGVKRAVFLDRDGVLNHAIVRDGKPYPPATAADLEISAEAPAALADLQAAGFLLIVVTNQPDVARGRQTRAAVEAIMTVCAKPCHSTTSLSAITTTPATAPAGSPCPAC